jgi:hypothetical protein
MKLDPAIDGIEKAKCLVDNNGNGSLDDLPLSQLTFRAKVLSDIIRQAQRDGDKRWKDLVPQQRRLNEAIARKESEERAARGEPEPEPVHVSLGTAKVTARRIPLDAQTKYFESVQDIRLMPLRSARVARAGIEFMCTCGRPVIMKVTRDDLSVVTCECGKSYGARLSLCELISSKPQEAKDG